MIKGQGQWHCRNNYTACIKLEAFYFNWIVFKHSYIAIISDWFVQFLLMQCEGYWHSGKCVKMLLGKNFRDKKLSQVKNNLF